MTTRPELFCQLNAGLAAGSWSNIDMFTVLEIILKAGDPTDLAQQMAHCGGTRTMQQTISAMAFVLDDDKLVEIMQVLDIK